MLSTPWSPRRVRNGLRDAVASGIQATVLFLVEGPKVRRTSELSSVTLQGAYNSAPDYVFGLATRWVGRNSEEEEGEEEAVGPLEFRLASYAPGAGSPYSCFA